MQHRGRTARPAPPGPLALLALLVALAAGPASAEPPTPGIFPDPCIIPPQMISTYSNNYIAVRRGNGRLHVRAPAGAGSRAACCAPLLWRGALAGVPAATVDQFACCSPVPAATGCTFWLACLLLELEPVGLGALRPAQQPLRAGLFHRMQAGDWVQDTVYPASTGACDAVNNATWTYTWV